LTSSVVLISTFKTFAFAANQKINLILFAKENFDPKASRGVF